MAWTEDDRARSAQDGISRMAQNDETFHALAQNNKDYRDKITYMEDVIREVIEGLSAQWTPAKEEHMLRRLIGEENEYTDACLAARGVKKELDNA